MSSESTEKYVIWNSDTDYALGHCKLINQLLGIWPFECQSLFSKIRIIVVFISQVAMGIHCIRELRANCMEDHEVVSFMGLVMISWIFLIKVAVLRINKSQMESILTSAVIDWYNVKDSKSRDIMRGYAYIGRLVFLLEAILIALTVGTIILTTLPRTVIDNEITTGSSSLASSSSTDPPVLPTVTKRNLPLGTDCFVADLPSGLYVTIYVLQILQLLVSAAGNVGNDACFFSLTMHICAQFELIKRRLEEFGENRDIESCREELGRVVGRYNHMMTVAMTIEHVFNPIIFWILTNNALLFGFLGLELLISLKADNFSRVIMGIVTISILYLQLFLYSYASDCLSSQNDELGNAAYNCRWYDLSPTVSRNLILVIMKSNYSFHLTAGKIYEMNMKNFKNIIKTMFSYFSMLRIMFDK